MKSRRKMFGMRMMRIFGMKIRRMMFFLADKARAGLRRNHANFGVEKPELRAKRSTGGKGLGLKHVRGKGWRKGWLEKGLKPLKRLKIIFKKRWKKGFVLKVSE